MDDNPIPPLVDLARKASDAATWARLVQCTMDDPNYTDAGIKRRRASMLRDRLTALEAAIVRAREVLGG